MIWTIKPRGKHKVLGRGTIFVVDQREHDFPIQETMNKVILIDYNGTVDSYKVDGSDSFVDGFGKIKPVLGLIVTLL